MAVQWEPWLVALMVVEWVVDLVEKLVGDSADWLAKELLVSQ